MPLRDLGDQRLPIEMCLLHGLEDRPQLLAHVDLDNAQALFRHQREVGRGNPSSNEMARHHLLDVVAKGRRCPERQMTMACTTTFLPDSRIRSCTSFSMR